ncbi:MAG: glutaredoxin family protein [Deltaproteobacteria bacterium]|nr:glutaredoxin family protein [Deltaproteobacteria bacterium]
MEIPFSVQGEAEGFLLTWFDEGGFHEAQKRSEIPESARQWVRVDSPLLPPESRDPDRIFVADLRAPLPDGHYKIQLMERKAFEALAEAARSKKATPAAGSSSSSQSSEIVLFGASWCKACQQAEAYLRSRGVPFVKRDVDSDPSAQAEMLRRARAAGLAGGSIPLIDIRGKVIQGFNPQAIEKALAETAPSPSSTI